MAAKRRNSEAGILDDPRSAEPEPSRHWAYFIGAMVIAFVLNLIALLVVSGGA